MPKIEFNRTVQQWSKCDPKAMAKMSEAAIMYAIADARSDVLLMHAEIELLRDGLTLITCEPINAEYMAQNILDGLPAYHDTIMEPSGATRGDAKQVEIDSLMLEYCPDKMTTEQIAEWGKHQNPVNPNAKVTGLSVSEGPVD